MTPASPIPSIALAAALLVSAAAFAATPAAQPQPRGKDITRAAYEQRVMARFDKMDLDHNGVLSAAERAKARAAAPHHGCAATPAHKA